MFKQGSGRKRILSEEEIARALKYRENGVGWKSLARMLGVSVEVLRRSLDGAESKPEPSVPKTKLERLAFKSKEFSTQHALYDPQRDGVRTPTTLTGLLMGDPFPNRRELLENWFKSEKESHLVESQFAKEHQPERDFGEDHAECN